MRNRVACARCGAHRDTAIWPGACLVCGDGRTTPVPPSPADVRLEAAPRAHQDVRETTAA